jgi:predicted transcriptional regulator
MQDKPFEKVGDVFNTLSGEKRVKSFYLMFSEGSSPKDAGEEIGVTRQGVQRYIRSWKEAGLIYSEGNDYLLTDSGESAKILVEEALDEF